MADCSGAGVTLIVAVTAFLSAARGRIDSADMRPTLGGMGRRDSNRLLTLEGVAEFCGVAPLVVHRWINRGALTVCFLESGEPRFRQLDVEKAWQRHLKHSGNTTRNIPKLRASNKTSCEADAQRRASGARKSNEAISKEDIARETDEGPRRPPQADASQTVLLEALKRKSGRHEKSDPG